MPFKDRNRYQSEEWKEYQRNYQRSWHQHHRAKRLARMYERKAAIYEYVQNIKSQLCCVDCGQRHPATLHFHHLNSEDKVFNISDAARRGTSLDRIKADRYRFKCRNDCMVHDRTGFVNLCATVDYPQSKEKPRGKSMLLGKKQ